MRRPLSLVPVLLVLLLALTSEALAGSRQDPGPCAATGGRAVKVERDKPCTVAIAANAGAGFTPSVLTLSTLDPEGEFSAKYTPKDATWPTGQATGPSAVIRSMESSGSATRQSFLRWASRKQPW